MTRHFIHVGFYQVHESSIHVGILGHLKNADVSKKKVPVSPLTQQKILYDVFTSDYDVITPGTLTLPGRHSDPRSNLPHQKNLSDFFLIFSPRVVRIQNAKLKKPNSKTQILQILQKEDSVPDRHSERRRRRKHPKTLLVQKRVLRTNQPHQRTDQEGHRGRQTRDLRSDAKQTALERHLRRHP